MIILHRTPASTKFTATTRFSRITCRVELSPEDWHALGAPDWIQIDPQPHVPEPDEFDQPIDLS